MKIRFEVKIIKKSHCCICGKKMKRKITFKWKELSYRPFGIKFLKQRTRSYWLLLPVYYCEKCDYMIEYSNQCIIQGFQKDEKILSNGKTLVKKYKIN